MRPPDPAEETDRKSQRVTARDDRLRRAVCLDEVPDQDPDEQRPADGALGDGEAEGDRLGDAVDEEPGCDRLAAGRLCVPAVCGHRHRLPRGGGVSGAAHLRHRVVAGEPRVGGDVDDRPGDESSGGDPGAGSAIRLGDEFERDRGKEEPAPEGSHDRGDPLGQLQENGGERPHEQARGQRKPPAERRDHDVHALVSYHIGDRAQLRLSEKGYPAAQRRPTPKRAVAVRCPTRITSGMQAERERSRKPPA